MPLTEEPPVDPYPPSIDTNENKKKRRKEGKQKPQNYEVEMKRKDDWIDIGSAPSYGQAWRIGANRVAEQKPTKFRIRIPGDQETDIGRVDYDFKNMFEKQEGELFDMWKEKPAYQKDSSQEKDTDSFWLGSNSKKSGSSTKQERAEAYWFS